MTKLFKLYNYSLYTVINMSNRIIIDILAPKIEQSPYFVVDNTIMQVPVIAGDANPVPLINAIGDSVFQIGDTCQILSCGFVLPHSFTLGQTGSGYPFWTHQFYFARDPAWNTPIGLEHMANNTNGQLGVFLENYEMFIFTRVCVLITLYRTLRIFLGNIAIICTLFTFAFTDLKL